jgi:hypothetical protein
MLMHILAIAVLSVTVTVVLSMHAHDFFFGFFACTDVCVRVHNTTVYIQDKQ